MDAENLINVSILQNLIKQEINNNVNENINTITSKLKKLEEVNLNDSVEIYGIHDTRLNYKKIRVNYIKKICSLLNLDFKFVVENFFDRNHIVVRLTDAVTAREWQKRSRDIRINNYDLNINFDAPVKIFVAASHEHKQLLKKTRDVLLSSFKYVSLCKNGVMVRKNERSKIYVIKNENDIYNLLLKSKSVSFECDENLSDNVEHNLI
ncbi:few polyhedra plaque phenotype associated protein [Adoxophyes honmai nucleopolyhedrovirus]|uniref:Few polyhedra plaque phenotype associated protein n=1 Tax=Adoxophyes honmai nucleopolyhedrovirus TaxID=224399 RepID=Q80LR0_NPVAH|nr:few polyhedra plaque phenotype associated protein [Adoxophyes honmai nucleopolyhedrovirus]BAC67287.1 few polyhedra plaque phenotype associated protein [Adoxophyes honmai nucleopolyhedrovirus]